MIRYSRLLLYFTIVVLLLWILPWMYNFLTARTNKTPFTLYSSVIDDYAVLQPSDKGVVRKDLGGNVYSESEFDSILPMFYYRQLIADGRLPERMKGVELNPKVIQTENFIFRHSPDESNRPVIGLYPLLESSSGRVDLVMPEDVFHIDNDCIEFIDIKSNCVDEKKSQLFTKALQKKGFIFPARIIAGNPTTRKDYDEGYLLIDKENNLFHMKQVVGRSFVRKIDIPEGIVINHIFLTEFKNRKILAFLTDKQNRLYVLLTKSYRLISLPVTQFDPTRQSISVIGNLFDWTINISDDNGDEYYAIDARDYGLLKRMERPNNTISLSEKIGGYIFPVRLTFTSLKDKWVKARFVSGSFN